MNFNEKTKKSIKIAGADILGYSIAADLSSAAYCDAAKMIADAIYECTGYNPEIVSLDKADKSIVIKSGEKIFGEDSFKVTLDGSQMLIECSFDNKLNLAIEEFINEKIIKPSGDINFEGKVFSKDISFVTYEEFGATDNGEDDNDFEAIYKAHVFANEGGQTVKIIGSPTYCIKEAKIGDGYFEIPIKTAVRWGNAKIIIDDSNFSVWDTETQKSYTKQVFSVEPSIPMLRVAKEELPENIELHKGMKKIDYAPGFDAIIRPISSKHRIYRRRGYWSISLGSNSSEILKIDKDGNISSETPVMWDYPSIDYIDVYYIDKEPITLEGGIFVTKATKNSVFKEVDGKMQLRDNYFARGLKVKRSNTTVKDVQHYIENEITLKEHSEKLLVGNTYMGFFIAQFSDSVTFLDCTMTAHRCFTKPRPWPGGGGTQGTYDFHASFANKITLKNCRQSNFWVTVDENDGTITPANKDTLGAVSSMAREQVFKNPLFHDGKGALMHWGLGESDFCKNLEYNGCVLSRFDAHQGLYNGKIINSELNIIALTGMGEMIIENSTQYSLDPSPVYNNLLHMRSDYGSTWDGEIKIKNHKAYLYTGEPFVFMHSYVNWYMGYECAYPTLTLDNVKYFNADTYYKTRESVEFPSGSGIKLNTGGHIKDEPQMHLATTKNTSPWRQYSDYDGDGIVDNFEKFNSGKGHDFNGDGKIDELDKKFNLDLLNDRTATSSHVDRGILDENSRENLNPVKPPLHIKVFGGGSDVRYIVDKTDNLGALEGGFFGKTKFYYAPDKFYTGTGEEKKEDENTFIFS